MFPGIKKINLVMRAAKNHFQQHWKKYLALFFIGMAVIGFFVPFVFNRMGKKECGEKNDAIEPDFIRSSAVVAYRHLIAASVSDENVLCNTTTTFIIENKDTVSPRIDFHINTYTITDSKGLNAKYMACAFAPKYGVYCTAYFNALSLVDEQKSCLAYRAIEEYYVHDVRINFYKNYKHVLAPIKYKADENEPNFIFYATWYYDRGFYNTSNHAVWIVPFDEFKLRVASNVNHVCDDRTLAQYGFYELLGLPLDLPGITRHFVFGHVDIKEASINSHGVYTRGFFRPCVSPNIASLVCAAPMNFNSSSEEEKSDHDRWMESQYRWAYLDDTNPDGRHYPWTARGFTYNWYPWSADHYGLSEYVLAEQTQVNIIEIKTLNQVLDAYCP